MNNENLLDLSLDIKKVVDKIDILKSRAHCLNDDVGVELCNISEDKKATSTMDDEMILSCRELYSMAYDICNVMRRYCYG